MLYDGRATTNEVEERMQVGLDTGEEGRLGILKHLYVSLLY